MADMVTREASTGPLLTAGPRAAVLTALSPVPGARDPKLAERIAAAIESDVLREGWPVGKAVGSEDQLAGRYGVGRAVIREAIRLAEHRQVVRMRRGRSGGLHVVEPDVSAVTDSLAIFLQYAKADVDDLIEARTVLEVSAATAAATVPPEGMTAAALAAAASDEPGCSDQPTGPSARRLHELVARATGNAALLLFIQAIAALTDRLAALDGRDAPAGARRSPGRRRHQAIASAIASGEAAEAADLMRADMDSLQRAVKRLAAQSGQHGPEMTVLRASAGRVPHRPADLLAERIQREIIERGWPVGESLGFEAELLQRYGIGRAQFREAVRILENHSVVRMQRGVAGGMLVTAPDGRAVVRVTALYLTYQGMNTAHIRDLRAHLEAATLRLTIDRLTEAGVRRLEALVELERTWPDDDFPAVSHDLHAVIAELSGNRTLALLQSIAMQLTAERLHSGDPHRVTERPDAVRRAHRAIVAAIIARDTPLALRRMEKHLGAIARWTLERSSSGG